MNVGSQISAENAFEYNTINSINSFNFIYKKAIIREKYSNIVNQIRSFNFENIANNKMKHMNFSFIINTIINLRKMINNNSPYMRYVKYVKPYNLKKTKIIVKNNKNIEKPLFNGKNKIINIKKNFPKKNAEIINFVNRNNYKNFYYTRMCNNEFKKININITEKIILLQKNIRGFLSRKVLDENINNVIAKNIIKSVLIIQRGFRKFLYKKNKLDKLIIKIIKNERNIKGNKITDIFSLYHYRNLYKKHLLIKKIVISRYKSASLIQSKFKSFIIRRKIKDILKKEKNSYILTYPFQAETVQIKIYKNKTFKIYNYFICPIRKYFVLYIDKKQIEPGEYLCHIIVDNNIKIDNRYNYKNKNNVIYNLIGFGNYSHRTKKPKKIETEIEKKNKIIKKQKDKEKQLNDEIENFYIYYYNNNDDNDNGNDNNSFNSYSTNSEHEKNKLDYRNQIDEDDPDQVIDISKQFFKSKINKFFLKSNYKYIKDNKKLDIDENNDIELLKEEKKEEEEEDEDEIEKKISYKIFDRFEYLDGDDNSLHQSESLNYNNILDELSESKNSIISNISMKNINSYSKKTHKTKYNNENKHKKEGRRKYKNISSLKKLNS